MSAARARGRRRGNPKRLDSVLAGVLGDLGLEAAAVAYRVGECWLQAVGADVARHARPAGIRSGVLVVNVDSSVWSQQLQLSRDEILAALKREMGAEAPRELRFRVG